MTIFLLGIGLVAYIIRLFSEGTLFLIVAIFLLLSILYPYIEQFSINDNVITTKTIFCSLDIIIPQKSVIVITQADIRPVFSRQSFLLKEKFAISILQDMTLENALSLVHSKYTSQFMYTNSTIENTVDAHKFVYSFVLTKELLKKVLQNTKCFLIIPESIKNNIIIDDPSIDVYIDSNY